MVGPKVVGLTFRQAIKHARNKIDASEMGAATSATKSAELQRLRVKLTVSLCGALYRFSARWLPNTPFATTLQNLGVGTWQRIASILGFDLGIETMQLIVVGAVLPSLVILSRTPAYTIVRFGGALFAGIGSPGWIIERLFGVREFVDGAVNRIAQRGVWIAISLIAISIVLCLLKSMEENDAIKNVFEERAQNGRVGN
jgi:hypothetical protein